MTNYMMIPGLKKKDPVTLSLIMNCVSDLLHIPKERIKDISRKRELVEARQLFTILARSKGKTLKTIGDYLGKDHATVIWSVTSYNNLMATDIHYRHLYEQAKTMIA